MTTVAVCTLCVLTRSDLEQYINDIVTVEFRKTRIIIILMHELIIDSVKPASVIPGPWEDVNDTIRVED